MKSYSNVLGPDPRFGEGGQTGQWSFVSNNSASMEQRNQFWLIPQILRAIHL